MKLFIKKEKETLNFQYFHKSTVSSKGNTRTKIFILKDFRNKGITFF